MNAIDTIKALIVAGGTYEARKALNEMANAELEATSKAKDRRTPLQIEIDAASEQVRVMMATSRGVWTQDLERTCRRLEYLKVLKRMGRTTDAG